VVTSFVLALVFLDRFKPSSCDCQADSNLSCVRTRFVKSRTSPLSINPTVSPCKPKYNSLLDFRKGFLMVKEKIEKSVTLSVLLSWTVSFILAPLSPALGAAETRPNLMSDTATGIQKVQVNAQSLWSDSDFDGLSDNVETAGWYNEAGGPFRTNPFKSDSDGDGLTDGEEQLYGTNPLNDTSPGLYAIYSNGLKTSKYFPWQRHGNKYIAFDAVVVRRGSVFYIGGPAGATVTINKSISSLSSVSVIPPSVCGTGRWEIQAPAAASTYGGTGGTVGKYTITMSKGGWSKTMKLYVIFELPPNMSEDDVAAFVYSDDPNNIRDEYSIFYITSENSWPDWPNYHRGIGYGYAFKTDYTRSYVFEGHVIDAINGYTRQSDAVTQLARRIDYWYQFEPNSIRFNMQDALNAFNHMAQCSTHANTLAGFSRAAGIPARAFGADWDQSRIPNVLFDYSTMVWIANGWQGIRAYNNENEQPFPNSQGGIRPLGSLNFWYSQTNSDMIITGRSNWLFSDINYYYNESPSWDYQIGNFNKNQIVRWDWLETLARAVWGWSQEPADVGNPPQWIPWPCCTPTPTPTRTPTQPALLALGAAAVAESTPIPTPTATPTPTTIDGSLFVPLTSLSQNTPTDPSLSVAQNGTQGVQIGQITGDYGVDVDGNGRLDQLVVEVEINVTQPGYYNLQALLDNDKFNAYTRINGIALAKNYTYLEAGTHKLQLPFDGKAIEEARVDGPYQVKAVWISNLAPDVDPTTIENGPTWLDKKDTTYMTKTYRASDFETAVPARLTNAYSHQVYDTNGDGYFDRLSVNTNLNIFKGGNYRVEADLVNSQGEVVATAQWAGSDGQVLLQFEGLLGDVTPYFLNNVRLFDAGGGLIDLAESSQGVYLINPLYNLGLSAASVVMPTVTSATTSDTNNDGKADSLNFNVKLTIAVPGQYRLEGWLESSAGAPISWQTSAPVSLNAGTQTMSLSFPGQAINVLKANGPYKLVALKVLQGAYTVIDEIPVAYETASYAFANFDGSHQSDNFVLQDDGDSNNWNMSATTWGLTGRAFHSPSYSWTDSPNGNYSPGQSWLTSKSIPIKNGAAPVISFQSCYDIKADGDNGKLQWRAADGAWKTIDRAIYSGTTDGWVSQEAIGFPVIGANSLELRFVLDANTSNHAEGWYVDDVLVSLNYDLDNDGIPNDVEIGNDPNNPRDSNGDGIPDYLDGSKRIYLPIIQKK
jgi:hypothetical protein